MQQPLRSRSTPDNSLAIVGGSHRDRGGGQDRMKLFAKKPLEVLLAQANEQGEHSLKRGLGPSSLTLLGIGGVIGAGIFVLTGQQAAINAGPAIFLSFVLAGVVCVFAAMCYAELASMIPVSGSAYTYTYATLGEFIAWLIAWDLILEYGLASATVAVGWSGHFGDMLQGFGLGLPHAFLVSAVHLRRQPPDRHRQSILNIPAVAIVCAMGGAPDHRRHPERGGQQRHRLAEDPAWCWPWTRHRLPATCTPNTGIRWSRPRTPDGHFGLPGGHTAAGVIFFAYIGVESVSTAAQLAKNPQRVMPIGILASLGICTVLYILMSLVITGIAPYSVAWNNEGALVAIALGARAGAGVAAPDRQYRRGHRPGIDHPVAALRPVAHLLRHVARRPAAQDVRPGEPQDPHADLGHGLDLGQRRTGRRPVPDRGAGRAGVDGHLAGLRPDLRRGALSAHHRAADLKRSFKTPLVWVTAPLGAAGCIFLISGLPAPTWWRLFIWMAIGLVVYFGYAHRHSLYGKDPAPAE